MTTFLRSLNAAFLGLAALVGLYFSHEQRRLANFEAVSEFVQTSGTDAWDLDQTAIDSFSGNRVLCGTPPDDFGKETFQGGIRFLCPLTDQHRVILEQVKLLKQSGASLAEGPRPAAYGPGYRPALVTPPSAETAPLRDSDNEFALYSPEGDQTDSEGSGVFPIWTVRSGDTLAKIAEARGTTVERIAELNSDVEPGNLTVGDRLILPAEPAASCAGGGDDCQTARPERSGYTRSLFTEPSSRGPLRMKAADPALLLSQINDEDRNTRRSATAELERMLAADPDITDSLIAMIGDPETLEELSSQGRYNVLYLLTEAPESAWTGKRRQDVCEALRLIRAREKQGIRVGDQTGRAMLDIEAKAGSCGAR